MGFVGGVGHVLIFNRGISVRKAFRSDFLKSLTCKSVTFSPERSVLRRGKRILLNFKFSADSTMVLKSISLRFGRSNR